MICRRNTTLTGYQTSDAAITSSLRRSPYTKLCRRVTYGLLTHGKLISSSSPSTCPATSARLMASPPSDMHALFWHPRFNISPPSCHSGIGVSALTTSLSPLTITELAFTPWFENKNPFLMSKYLRISLFWKRFSCFSFSLLWFLCFLKEDVARADGIPEFLKKSIILQTFGVKHQHPCQDVENVLIPPYVSPEKVQSTLDSAPANGQRDIWVFFRGKMEVHPKNISGRFYSK